MPMHNKLVRDRTIEFIDNKEIACTYSYLSEEEYVRELRNKLQEEVGEFLEENNVMELADVLEVVFALAKSQGTSEEELMRLRNMKLEERGGFEQRIFLQETNG